MQQTQYRERVPMPGWVVPLMGAFGGIWIGRRVRGLGGRGSAPRKLFSLLNGVTTVAALIGTIRRFGYVAIEVQPDDIRLGYGPFERRIRATSVRDVRVAPYNPLPFLGWGYRTGSAGRRAFSQVGVPSGVEITAQEGDRQLRYFVSSNEPEALASAIATVAGVSAAV